jgi:hypothetical protein
VPRSANIEGGIEAAVTIKINTFRKGATLMATPSHVQKGLGFHPWMTKDGNGAVSGRISMSFGSRGFKFGDDFSPMVFGFGALKPIGFGFGLVFHPWISNGYIRNKSFGIKTHVL